MKKVIFAGGTGMIGNLILEKCFGSSDIKEVISLVRKSTGNKHEKLTEVVVGNFSDYSQHQNLFEGVDIAFFCIGVYAGQVSDTKFKEITVDYAVAFAKALKSNSATATLCFLSGQGADRKEKSRLPFAKYKGMAENQISNLGLGAFHAFRPSYIYPVEPRKAPNFVYKLSRTLYPLIKLFGKNTSIKSTELAEVMFQVGRKGGNIEILENKDMLDLLSA